jgi:hypothetical protein
MLLKTRMMLKLVAPFVFLALVQPASAFKIKRVSTDSGVVLKLRGAVSAGDYHRLKEILESGSVVGLEIRSGGGSLEEGLDIARVVRDKSLVVYASSECDSACALIFFAATERYIGRRCKIGVHSVSNERGKEDGDSVRTTVQMSRLLVGLGVPHSVIGKLVATPPTRITYLDNRELVELNVRRTNPFRNIYDLASVARNPGDQLDLQSQDRHRSRTDGRGQTKVLRDSESARRALKSPAYFKRGGCERSAL